MKPWSSRPIVTTAPGPAIHCGVPAGVTLNLLWPECLEQHPGGYAYSQFCALYRAWRKHLGVTMRQDHKAGEKLFVDFPGLTIPIYDPATLQVTFEAELFVTVLGASSYLYVEALRSQELMHWVNAHCHAFSFYDVRVQPNVSHRVRVNV